MSALCSEPQDTLALIIDQQNIDVVISNNLKEINLGPWEGKTKQETLLSDPQQYHYFWQEQDKFNLAGAETYQQLQDRVVSKLQAIFSKEKGKNILIVSHWIAIKAAVAYYKSTPLSDLSSLPDPKNGEYTILSEPNTQIKKAVRVFTLTAFLFNRTIKRLGWRRLRRCLG
ncbi:histidine phosphatase family protein [Marinomonas sp. GJ51-6]|uniref:histidine phosphatase family protein n=1 Tax=Marinomonas sp. GJ51-6 TaxID=2992802 RepID=UPI002934EBDC|nr:histidine phosphatase family protein [Marinomonas sp. GJ51-6]WOD08938.1 histidine phosphatase family protein [Marinomonas sp. GJ51-6]